MAAAGDDAGLTQRELLMEMREGFKGLRAAVDSIARGQAAGVGRRAAVQRSADSIYERLDGHDRDPDRVQAWQDRADGAWSSRAGPSARRWCRGPRRGRGP